MSHEDVQKFANEHVSVEATVSPGCVVKLNVTVNPSLVAKSYQTALHNVRKEVSIPGFRKGKAPDTLLMTHYSKAVDGEWRDALLNQAFQASLELSHFTPLKAEARTIKSALKDLKSPKEEAILSYEFEFIPQAPTIDISTLQLEATTPKEVTQEDVDNKIEQIRLSLSDWEEITGRPVQAGDFVRLDVVELKDGQEIPNFENQRFEIQDKKMSPWLQKLVIGLNVGESSEGMSAPDEALIEEDVKAAFEPTLFKATVHAIEKPSLPELNEVFARKLGVSTMEEVYTNLKKQLERQASLAHKEVQRRKLEDALYAAYTFDLPSSLLAKSKDKESEKRQLTLYYLMRKFNHENGIEVTNDDLNRELNDLMQQFPREMWDQISKSFNDEMYASILSEVVVRKGIDQLLHKLS